MNRPFWIISMIFLVGCAGTKKASTPVWSAKGSGDFGYSVQVSDSTDQSMLAVYEGNPKMSPQVAKSLAMVTAIDTCQRKQMVTHFLGPAVDFTEETQVSRIGAYSAPAGYMGNPAMPSTPLVYSFPVKVYLPKVAVPFRCGKKFPLLAAEQDLEPLSRELIHPTTNDYHGGLMIRVSRDTQLKSRGLEAGDIIIRVNQQRIETIAQLNVALEEALRNPVPASVIRKGKVQSVAVKYIDTVDMVKTIESKALAESCGVIGESGLDVPPCRQL